MGVPVSAAHELLRKAFTPEVSLEKRFHVLTSAARRWRADGEYCYAGYAMSWAVDAALFAEKQPRPYLRKAWRDFATCIERRPPDSLEGLAALIKWDAEAKRQKWIAEFAVSDLPGLRKALWTELGQRLLACYSDSPRAESYLVKGVILRSDLKGNWETSYPECEVRWGEENWEDGGVAITLPSAFHLFMALNDYQGAQAVIDRCPEAFTSPNLEGWKFAVRGFVRPETAPESFAEAARAFAADTTPAWATKQNITWDDLAQRSVLSASVNVQMWAPYFRARSAVAAIMREPGRVRELIRKAADEIRVTESGWLHSNVVRFRVLVQTLAQLAGDETTLTPEDAREDLFRASLFDENEEGDEVVEQFMNAASEALEGFKVDPAREITTGRLPAALDALARIPFIGPEVAKAVTPVIGEGMWSAALGPIRTWMHRTLQSITDEKQLQKVILRLAQASLPPYAQIRHGPVEYGKDVVVLFEEDGRRVLRMYQVKCGDITKSKWREAREELEEIFLVPQSEFQVGGSVDVREGVLVCNGHANPYAEPIMESWFAEQRRAHGRSYSFTHLDGIVRWITAGRHVNEFRLALDEIGLEPIMKRLPPGDNTSDSETLSEDLA